jgi:hypothetical protein
MFFLQNKMTIWRYIKYPINGVLLTLLLCSCFQSDYTKLVKSELGKGVRQDSLLLGIYFGETRNDFYGKCFDLNKQELATDGGGGFVEYFFKDSLVHETITPIKFLFRPNFDSKNKLAEMILQLSYPGSTPSVPAYQSDSLGFKVEMLLKKWYRGNDFINVKLDNVDVPVKLDGNRRILIYKLDQQTVQVKIQDILHPIFKHSISMERDKENSASE